MTPPPDAPPGAAAAMRRLAASPWLWYPVAAGLAAFFLVKTHRLMGKWELSHRPLYLADFENLHKAASRLRDGESLYRGTIGFKADLDAGKPPLSLNWSVWYSYPPITAVLMRPAAEGTVESAGRAWLWLNAGLLLAAIALACAAADPRRVWIAAPLLLLAVYMWPVRFNFYQGQVEAALLFAFALAAWLLRRGCDAGAGAVIGFAAAVKMFPAFLVLGLLTAGRFRAAAAAAAVGAAVTLVGFSVAGWACLPDFVEVAGLKSHIAVAGWPSNQSLTGFLHRQWHEECGNHLFAAASHRPGLARTLSWIGTAAVLAAYLGVEWRRRGRWTALGLGSAVSTQILLLPFADSYYATELLLPMAVAFAAAADLPLRRRVPMIAALAVSLYLVGARDSDWLKEEAVFTGGRAFAETWMNNLWISRVWLGELGLWLCLMFLRLTERRGAAEPEAPADAAAAARTGVA